MSKGFKDEILNNLGGQVRCVSSCLSSKRFSTFQIITESIKKIKRIDKSLTSEEIYKDNKD